MPSDNGPTAAVPLLSRYAQVGRLRMHYVECGEGEPAVLLLHGLPCHSYLWRNVIPHVAPVARTVAIDLPGFGKTDKPMDLRYELPTYAEFVAGAVAALGLRKLVLVGMDLGLMVGLYYAMRHETSVARLVLFEGFVLPIDETLRSQSVRSRLWMLAFGVRSISERAFVLDGAKIVDRVMSHGMVSRLSESDLAQYRRPMADDALRRRVWLEGVGTYRISRAARGADPIAGQVAEYASWLSTSPLPKLMLHAEPGLAATKATVRLAQRRIADLEVQSIGRGKHFLPEDQPDRLGRAIADFASRGSLRAQDSASSTRRGEGERLSRTPAGSVQGA